MGPASHFEARQVISLDVTSESDPYVVAEPFLQPMLLLPQKCRKFQAFDLHSCKLT